MPQAIYVSESVEGAIATAAERLRSRYSDKNYSIEDLQAALVKWLEVSIEQLADDAVFHVLEGTEAYAFNRPVFDEAMRFVD